MLRTKTLGVPQGSVLGLTKYLQTLYNIWAIVNCIFASILRFIITDLLKNTHLGSILTVMNNFYSRTNISPNSTFYTACIAFATTFLPSVHLKNYIVVIKLGLGQTAVINSTFLLSCCSFNSKQFGLLSIASICLHATWYHHFNLRTVMLWY